MIKPGRAIHPSNGTGAVTTPISISFDAGSNRGRSSTGQVIVSNLTASGGNSLGVSFANGKDGTFFLVPPQMTLTFPVSVHNCVIRGEGGSADYSIMGIIQ